jgi:hypothetical protein
LTAAKTRYHAAVHRSRRLGGAAVAWAAALALAPAARAVVVSGWCSGSVGHSEWLMMNSGGNVTTTFPGPVNTGWSAYASFTYDSATAQQIGPGFYQVNGAMSVMYGGGAYQWSADGPLRVTVIEQAGQDRFTISDPDSPHHPAGMNGFGGLTMIMPPTTLSGTGLPTFFDGGICTSTLCETSTGFPSWTAPPGSVGYQVYFELNQIHVVPAPAGLAGLALLAAVAGRGRRAGLTA